ncbi:hypothetical protein CH333_08810 [candidate division WOR-3 bacterium JGI_Cruoil_03_44_89]|uniref:DUF58 domain-containing protein n=1 Tax=candidate division WOR-3 bacterium JGI_Cruoil_03_44_89 TaxID=1973748 RepID=A0A235BPU3_UNCW3|nr:MAG: hypothetical protein CH333_08810 [candidate division WOR-3 bacterium JGI_Cruoil_03_44_89]
MRKHLDPHIIAQMRSLELKVRAVVDGFLVGIHKSPYHGFSQEFVEHRQYMPGDEPRYIDWKVYGRTDRLYLKQFEEERNLRAYVVLDGSRSMAYRQTGAISKWEYASIISASFAYILVLNKDAVSVSIFDTSTRRFVPPSTTRANLSRVFDTLEDSLPSGKTRICKAIEELSEKAKRRAFILVLSDLFDDENTTISSLLNLRARGNELVVVQILDPAEREFPFRGSVRLRDMETGEELLVDANSARDRYRENMNSFLSRIRSELWRNNIDYITVDTNTPMEKVLYFIFEREKV